MKAIFWEQNIRDKQSRKVGESIAKNLLLPGLKGKEIQSVTKLGLEELDGVSNFAENRS